MNEVIKRIELSNGYNIVVKNDPDECRTKMGINDLDLYFDRKQDVIDHINLLNKALEFWQYD